MSSEEKPAGTADASLEDGHKVSGELHPYITQAQYEEGLIRQEHRLVRILQNFFVLRPTWPKNDSRRGAATEALIFRFVQSLTPVAVTAGVSFTAIAGVVIAFQANRLIEAQNGLLKAQTTLLESQTKQIALQTTLSEANRRAASAFELANVLDAIAKAVENKTGMTKLSPALYGRIAALSRTLRPYRYLEDSGELCENPLSPERGQLLVSLISANVDLDPIRYDADFTRAVLDSANLRGAALANMNLASASMRNANLAHVDLRGANLTDADLRGAYLWFSDLSGFSTKTVTCPTHTEGVKWRGADLSYSLVLKPVVEFAAQDARLDGVLTYGVADEQNKNWTSSKVEVPNELKSFPVQIVRNAFAVEQNDSDEQRLEHAKELMLNLVRLSPGPNTPSVPQPAFINGQTFGSSFSAFAAYSAIPERVRNQYIQE